MNNKVAVYPVLIKEVYLDLFGHMNNAMYLTLFEEARWELIVSNGYDLKKIKDTGLGPVILGVNVRYLREIRARDEIVMRTRVLNYKKTIATLEQIIMRDQEVCCTAEFTFGLFDTHARKLVSPTPEWLKAIGFEQI